MEIQKSYKLGFQYYRCCNVSVSVLSSARASISLLRSSPARVAGGAGKDVPHLPSPTSTAMHPAGSLPLSEGAEFPRKNDRLCYLFLWQPLASSCPFPSQCRRTPNISLCSRRKQRRSNSSKHWLETPFLYTNYLQASSTNVWCEKSCFPQSSKTLLSMCRSELWKFIQRWQSWFENLMVNSNILYKRCRFGT